jgi:hypothetical protein
MMEYYDNDLFYQFKIRCELEFYNKPKYSTTYNKLKHTLIETFNKVVMDINLEKKVFFLHFFENTDINTQDTNQTLSYDHHIKFFISTLNEDNIYKVINSFKTYLNLQEQENKILSAFILLTNNKDKGEKEGLEAEYINLDKENYLTDFERIIKAKLNILCEKITQKGKVELKIELLKKNKNYVELREIVEMCLITGYYNKAIDGLNALTEIFNKTNDLLNITKAKETICLCHFVQEYTNLTRNDISLKELTYNSEFETILETCYSVYKKLKMYELAIKTLFKLAYYNVLFDNRKHKILDLVKRVYDDQETLQAQNKLRNLFKIQNILDYIGCRRKAGFYLYSVNNF